MTLCKDCDAPDLCLAFRAADEYVSPTGELRQIVGCDTEAYIFGDILKDADIKQIGIALTGEREQGGSSG